MYLYSSLLGSSILKGKNILLPLYALENTEIKHKFLSVKTYKKKKPQ